jgi:hypothetical protein
MGNMLKGLAEKEGSSIDKLTDTSVADTDYAFGGSLFGEDEVDGENVAGWDSLKFNTLWYNYPSKQIEHLGKNKKDIYENHCAINVSEALYQSGIRYAGNCTAQSCPNGGGHIIRATDLKIKIDASTKNVKTIIRTSLKGSTYESFVKGKTGIIYFEDYWHRPTDAEGVRTGDHIDLWDGNETASDGAFWTWVRQTFPQLAERYNSSDLSKSKIVIFWEIK